MCAGRIHRMGSHDVAVIGAGPAGAAAARLLAHWGCRVLVLDRAPAAAPAIAESIPPSCRKLFAAIGVLEAVDAAGFYRSTGNTVWWGGTAARFETFAAGALGYQVERAAFDAVLRDQARAAGARLRIATVRDVRPRDTGATIVLDDGEETARFVLDCSGRAGVIARRGWREERPGSPRTVALAGMWRSDRGWPRVEPTHTLVESHDDGWAWSVPLSPHVRCVAAMVDPQRTDLARGRPAAAVYQAELAKALRLSWALDGGALAGRPRGFDASVYTARRYADDPAMLVGDAASFVDPLSSYGIKKALASAWLAAVAVRTALRAPEMTATALRFFADREAEMAAALLEQARGHFGAAALTHPNPFWTDRAAPADLPGPAEPDVRVLREDPRVRAAFDALKTRPSLALEADRALRIEPRPVVRGDAIVLEDRLFTPAAPAGLRFLRDVDLAGLLALAPSHDQVPALFEAYNRRFPPVALPDFLGALSVMVAYGILQDSAAVR